MNTAIKTTTAARTRGWIFYDAACALCVRGQQRAGRLFASRGFEWLPLQTPGAGARLGVSESAFEFRMHVLTADGRVLDNADALGLLCRSVWWLWPFGVLLLVPGFRGLGRLAYDWFARNRYCVGGACRVDPNANNRVGFQDWAIAFLVPMLAGLVCRNQPAWVFMWALAFGLGFALKWLTWRDAIAYGACPSPKRAFAWFVVWPGLDGRTFFAEDRSVKRPEPREWFWAGAVMMFGAVLICLVVPVLMPRQAVIATWVGMVGIALFLHFGMLRFLSMLCRRCGVNAPPIMNAPLCATSLTEFWGARWNIAFSIPAKRLVLVPLTRRVGLPAAGFLVFLLSGLLHEVVISLPVRTGFGLPTLYFVLQAAGVAVERSRAGRGWGLGYGIKGWMFVILLTVGPLYWLFHPAFLRGVIVPFLKVLNHS